MSCHLEAVRAPTRRDHFSGRVLVLWMDHDRQTKDGASLAGAGSEAVRTCSEGSPTSYYGYASCPSICGCCLLGVCSAFVSQQQKGHQVLDDERWKHSDRYIRWFYSVSHPLIVNPAPELDKVMPRPDYQDILVDQEWARHPPNPLQVISSIRDRVEHAM